MTFATDYFKHDDKFYPESLRWNAGDAKYQCLVTWGSQRCV